MSEHIQNAKTPQRTKLKFHLFIYIDPFLQCTQTLENMDKTGRVSQYCKCPHCGINEGLGLLSWRLLIRVDLLSSEGRAHFAESLHKVFVFDGGSLHVFLLQRQQGSLETHNNIFSTTKQIIRMI